MDDGGVETVDSDEGLKSKERRGSVSGVSVSVTAVVIGVCSEGDRRDFMRAACWSGVSDSCSCWLSGLRGSG